MPTYNKFQSTRPHGARHSLPSTEAFHCGFNPRAHTGRDHNLGFGFLEVYGVSIHAPTRGATCFAVAYLVPPRCFNPRAHTGRDTVATISLPSIATFQSTRPHGARRECFRLPQQPEVMFQSTRPHGARRMNLDLMPIGIDVSIHAPTRGATGNKKPTEFTTEVSIHAPTRGATLITSANATNNYRFNPRAHTGRDGRNSTPKRKS